MAIPDANESDSGSGPASSDESPQEAPRDLDGYDDEVEEDVDFTPSSTVDAVTPMTGFGSYPAWAVTEPSPGPPSRSATGTVTAPDKVPEHLPEMPLKASVASSRPQRPGGPARTPSHTYAPARGPPQLVSVQTPQNRSTSMSRFRRDPNVQYRTQERAYVQRMRQGPVDYFPSADATYTPSVTYSVGSDAGDESPSSEKLFDGNADSDASLYYGNDDARPSFEELKIPANRERLEWHAMLASVLRGDVVRQEKKRLTGTAGAQGDHSRKVELWMGARSKLCGRSLAAQRRYVEDGRAALDPIIEAIIAFKIKGEKEAGKPPVQQVRDVVAQIERCENLYPTTLALETDKPRAASDTFRASVDAVMAWHTTTENINTELGILQRWVGNPELDFGLVRRGNGDPTDGENKDDITTTTATITTLGDDSSFLDRIIKEDGLRSLQGEHSMLIGVSAVIRKAKTALIEHAEAFALRYLPPYIEELLTLLNFPSRLIEEVIHVRLSYAKRMKDPTQPSAMMVEQMIAQFQILLRLAVRIKHEYTLLSQPEPGWELPPCISDEFDSVVVDALKFYFQMLNWKLSANKNTFKEAEILELEWDFSNEIGRYLDGGDVEVAEQFSSLTSKALARLATHFERELQRSPNESASEMDRRYKQNLDSVRVRQRKLFRFSRLLGQRFENATDFAIEPQRLESLYDALIESGHILIRTPNVDTEDIDLIAAPVLEDRAGDVRSILGTCYHAEEAIEDASHPYVLLIRPGQTPPWAGRTMTMEVRRPPFDLKAARVRLVADGSQARLANARAAFIRATGLPLDVIIEQRANLPRVYAELMRIKKTSYRLSNTIMDSVEIIRRQTEGLDCQDLIQTCFAFATEFGQRSLLFLDHNRRCMNNFKLTRLALDWISFICDDCVAADRKTFRWAVVALEFAMVMTRGQNILSLGDDEYARLRAKVGGCMALLVSHFDVMGARSSLAAQAERQRMEATTTGGSMRRMDSNRMRDDEEASRFVREQWLAQLCEIDALRKQKDAERQALGRVLEDSNEADRSLTYLSSSATNVTLRWQQGQFVGAGSFGSVYAAINLDSGQLMAVKEIRLQDPQLIPTIAQQIRDEMEVLEVLDHPNIVSYYGIEVHRDKVYIFMEYCSGGSVANLLEHGRIEDETVTMVYVLQMLEGLAYLHASGIVHRDIKPDNILLDHQGVIKYVDFGAAKIITRHGRTISGEQTASARTGQATSMTGTPMYMSPERIKGDYDGRSPAVDIWSFGCVVLEMVSGRRPWSNLDNEWAIMYNIAQGNSPQLPSRDQLSELGLDLLRRCFERDAAKRSTAAELLQHEWMTLIKEQVALDASTPSDTSSLSASTTSYRS